MKSKAILMTLAMMSAALAGCTGSDGVAEIDDETLQELFDDNIQDFMNNTSVTVNQEIHYHNNTTVDDSDNSVSTDSSVTNYNGSGSGSQLQMFTVEWDWSDVIDFDLAERIVLGVNPSGNNSNFNDDHSHDENNSDFNDDHSHDGNNSSFNNDHSHGNSGGGDPALLYVLFYNNAVIEFRNVECGQWLMYNSYQADNWEDWLRINYGADWNELHDKKYDLYYHFRDNDNEGYAANEQCQYYDSRTERTILYEIDVGIGEAMSFQVNGNGVITDVNCDDGYGTGLGNGTYTNYIGGQSECTVTGSTTVTYSLNYRYLYDNDGDTIRDSITGELSREYYTYFSSSTPEDFAVYFTMHDVVVYDIDDE